MKTIYFVRHGQSTGNIAPVYQAVDVPLTEAGKKQAQYVAERCAKLPIEVVVSSTQTRARETALIIAAETGHEVEFSDLFRERRKPSELNGKPFGDPEAERLNDKWWRSLMGKGPRALDGEAFEDLSARAGEALTYLIKRKEDNILVVTHGFYMRYLVARAIYGDALNGENFEPLARSLVMENTGITVLRHDASTPKQAWGEPAPWQFWIWNDHSHLG
ncbi:MAG: histidine phosphatase family protein [Patescibacteria group bacterium]